MDVDEIEVLRREIYRRITSAGILESDQIQLDNETAPERLPYCRITIAAAGEYAYASQGVMSRTVIAEFDVFGKALSDIRTFSSLAAAIEREFGKYDRDASKRMIAMPGFSGVSASVARYGRGADRVEEKAGLYRISVLLYVKISLTTGANYETQTGNE